MTSPIRLLSECITLDVSCAFDERHDRPTEIRKAQRQETSIRSSDMSPQRRHYCELLSVCLIAATGPRIPRRRGTREFTCVAGARAVAQLMTSCYVTSVSRFKMHIASPAFGTTRAGRRWLLVAVVSIFPALWSGGAVV